MQHLVADPNSRVRLIAASLSFAAAGRVAVEARPATDAPRKVRREEFPQGAPRPATLG